MLLDRIDDQIEKLPLLLNWTDSPFCLIGFGESYYQYKFFHMIKKQFAARPEVHYIVNDKQSGSELFSVLNGSSKEWVIIFDPVCDLMPHAIYTIHNAALLSDSGAIVAAEMLYDSKKPKGYISASAATLTCDERNIMGVSHLIVKRQLLMEYMPDNPINSVGLIADVARKLRRNEIRIQELPEFLIVRDSQDILPPRYSYNSQFPRLLAYSHEYSLTGAPIVFHQAMRILHNNNYQLHVVSEVDGPIFEQYVQDGISVSIDEQIKIRGREYWESVAENYDAVLVNTIVGHWIIDRLQEWNIPILWWIHDAEPGYKNLTQFLSKRVSTQVHIYCGGDHAKRVLQKYRPEYPSKILIYGLEDCSEKIGDTFEIEKDGKLLFSTIGSLETRKGQKILANAIDLLPQSVLNQCCFLIIGKSNDLNVLSCVKDLGNKYPENVKYIDSVPREQIFSVYKQTDCIICPSMDDPLPAYVSEGWMCYTPCICSVNTGSASLITEGENSFVYYDNDPVELKSKIEQFCQLTVKERAQIGANARLIFEREFSINKFQANLLKAVSSLFNKDNINELSDFGR